MQKFKYLGVVLLLGFVITFFNNRIATVIYLIVVSIIWVVNELENKQSSDVMQAYYKEHEKETTQHIKSTNQKLNELIQAIPFPMVYVNQGGELALKNNYFDKLNENNAENIYDHKIDATIKELMMDGFIHEKQFIKRFSYMGTIYQVHSKPIFEGKKYDGCIFLFQDITYVLEGEKMQQQFIADASHELKTPIAAILGMAEILNREGFDDPSTQKEFLAQIEKDAKRLSHIVNDLLLQSKLKADKIYLEKTEFNLRSFFDGILYDKRIALHQNNIKVKLDCPSDIIISADQFRLSQVFTNLMDNAINYTKDGKISITCSLWDKNLTIILEDNGQGIDKDHLPHIFERFYRGNVARDRKDGGSGLGLAISKSIIETHGGTMSVESEKGKGTRFIISLTQS